MLTLPFYDCTTQTFLYLSEAIMNKHQKVAKNTLLKMLAILLMSTTCYAEDLIILNGHGTPGRDVLELMGDGKSENFGRPIADNNNSDALHSYLIQGKNSDELIRFVKFTGDNCGPTTCLAMFFYKSFHGILDLSKYQALEFDIKVASLPTKSIGLRIGSWPARAEIDITERLPTIKEGWKTISLSMTEFKNNTFADFLFSRTEDVFSLGTSGKAEIYLSNIRWVE